MQSVRLHVAGNGVIWVMSRCRVCGDVNKHMAADAIVGKVQCKKCGFQMDMQAATAEALAAAHEALREAPDNTL